MLNESESCWDTPEVWLSRFRQAYRALTGKDYQGQTEDLQKYINCHYLPSVAAKEEATLKDVDLEEGQAFAEYMMSDPDKSSRLLRDVMKAGA